MTKGREGREPPKERRGTILPPPTPRYDKGPHERPTIHMIMGGPAEEDSNRARRKMMESMREWKGEIQHVFEMICIEFGVGDALVLKVEIGGFNVKRIFVDTGSSVNVMFLVYFLRMGLELTVEPVETSLFGFTRESVRVSG